MSKNTTRYCAVRGAAYKVQPIRSIEAIEQIKYALHDNPRDLCLFTFGINTAYRANELLSLSVGQVVDLSVGDVLEIRQSKNKKYRAIALNQTVINALQNWLCIHPAKGRADAPLFMSQHWRKRSLTVGAVRGLVKKWCREIGLNGNYGSHSLRKTWGYHQRKYNGTSVALLMRAYGHASEQQTLDYLGILADEIEEIYLTMEL